MGREQRAILRTKTREGIERHDIEKASLSKTRQSVQLVHVGQVPYFIFLYMYAVWLCLYSMYASQQIPRINYSCSHLHSSVPTRAFTSSYIHSVHHSLHRCTLSRVAKTLLPSPLHISSGTHAVLLYLPVFFCFLLLLCSDLPPLFY